MPCGWGGGVAGLVFALGLLALVVAPSAEAATRYQHAGGFGSTTDFANPQRMAVHQASGHLFIADRDGDRVRVYQADSDLPLTHLADLTAADRDDPVADNLDQPVALTVDQDSGELYVTKVGAPAELVRFIPTDPADPVHFTEDTSFNSPTGFIFHITGSFFDVGKVRAGIAIGRDAADNPLIFMLDPGANQLRAFDYSGAPAVAFGGFLPASTTTCLLCAGGSFSSISDLASGPDGSLYVTDVNSGQVRLRRFARSGATYDLAGTWLTGLTPTTPRVAVDQLSGEIVLANQTHYAQIEGPSSPSVRFTASIPPPPGFFGAATTAIAVLGDDGILGKRLFATGVTTTTDLVNYFVGATQIQVFDADGELPVAPDANMDVITDGDVDAAMMQLSGSVIPGEVGGKYRFEAVPCDADWNCAAWPATPNLSDPSLLTVPITTGDHRDSQPVRGELTGLEPNTNYRVRLLAINSDSAVTSPQVRETRTKLAAPGIVAGGAYSISAWRASLTGQIDPKHADNLYQFELTPAGGDPVLVPEQPLRLGGDAGPSLVSAEATGLEADTEYSFRLIAWPADDESLEGIGDPRTFTTRPESDSILPGRVYELVSPRLTNGVQSGATMLAPSGERALFKTRLPLADSENMNVDNRISRRNSDGSWTILPHRAGPPLVPGHGSNSFDAGRNPLVNQTFTHAAFLAADSHYDLSDEESYGGYLRDVESGELTWISSDPAIGQAGITSRNVTPVYVSDDARQVIFSTPTKLLPSDQSSADTLYEWKDGVVRQIAFRPGAPSPVGPSQRSLLGGGDGNDSSGSTVKIGEYRNAVSTDGSRIVYTIDGQAGATFRELYVNDDGNIVQVAPTTSHAEFSGASRDVSTVVFVQDGNLYTFDLDAEDLATETPELVHPSVSGGAGIYGALSVSDDGNRIYFASTKDVLGGTRAASPYALWVADRPDRESPYSIRYIAAVPRIAWNSLVRARQLGADTGGNLFAFLSTANLVPGRRTGGEPQAYVYEFGSDRIYCMSCPMDGSPAPGPASLQPGVPSSGGGSTRMIGSEIHEYAPAVRVISETGSIIFGAMAQLLPEDGDQISDVYEWRGGEISLISGGSGRYETASEISLDGKSILFTSPANLMEGLPESSVRRVYVAREGGGFIDNGEASTPCRGVECRLLDREAPVVPSRSSMTRRVGNAVTASKRNCRSAARRMRSGRRSVYQGRKRLIRLRARDAKPAHLRKARKRLRKARTNQKRLAKRLNSCRRAAR